MPSKSYTPLHHHIVSMNMRYCNLPKSHATSGATDISDIMSGAGTVAAVLTLNLVYFTISCYLSQEFLQRTFFLEFEDSNSYVPLSDLHH